MNAPLFVGKAPGKKSPANRGKYAEGKVRDYLKELDSAHVKFTFNRNLDAHAAGGRFQSQAGDFQALRRWMA